MMDFPLYAYDVKGRELTPKQVRAIVLHNWMIILKSVFKRGKTTDADVAWAAALNAELRKVT
jgi:hypothetical protein